MKNVILIIALAFTTLNANAQTVINGVTWADKNAGAFSPEDKGNLYNWFEAHRACPEGWRLPSQSEFDRLINTGSAWTTQNGVGGRIFGNPKNYIFLPESREYWGYYWTGTEYNTTKSFMALFLKEGGPANNNPAMTDTSLKGDLALVRCVKK